MADQGWQMDNPRSAALANIGPVDNPEMVAIVLGLVYVGDQIGQLVGQPQGEGMGERAARELASRLSRVAGPAENVKREVPDVRASE